MKLSKEDIKSLIDTGRIAGMPKGTYIPWFIDYDGRYRLIDVLDADLYSGIDCELCTSLTRTPMGVAFYLRFFF